MTIRRTLAALLVSVVITLVLACIYLFYPLVSALLSQTSGGPETGGIAAVVGGGKLPGFWWLLLTEMIVFVGAFGLLNRKRTKK